MCCGRRPATVTIDFRDNGGETFPACEACADEAADRGCTIGALRCDCRHCTDAAWFAIDTVERDVSALGRAVEAMRAMDTPTLRSLQWVGMMDEYWPLMYAELDRRGEPLS